MKSKKLLSILAMISMVIAMMFTVSTPALAAANPHKVTITNLNAGATVQVYKIIDLNYQNGVFEDPLYSWNTDVAAWLKDDATYNKYIDTTNKNEVKQEYIKLSSDNPNRDTTDGSRVPSNSNEITKFYQALSKEIRTSDSYSPKVTLTVPATGEVEFENLAQGQYLVLASESGNKSATKLYYPMVFNVLQKTDKTIDDQTLTMKQKPVTIEKEADDVTAGIGDTKNYVITTDIPVYPDNVDTIHYVIGDKLPKGLTLNKSSIEVYLKKSDDSEQRLLPENYSLNTTPATGENYTFKVTMNASILKGNPGCSILVKYSAIVNEYAVEDATYLENEAYLEINPDPFNDTQYTTIPTDELLFTYGIEFTKVDSNGTTPLTGATFKLMKNGKALKFIGNNGNYTLAQDQNNSNATDLLISNASGKYIIKGLDIGTYTLKEEKAPDGYVTPSGEATITLVDGGTGIEADGKLDSGTDANGLDIISKAYTNTATFSFTVKNSKPGDLNLPVTGGTGTLIFTLGGLAVMGAAVYLSVSKKKRNAK